MNTKWAHCLERLYNILIVEDLLIWQKNLKRVLRDEPFNVLIASNTKEAMDILKAYPIDILLLDINLSGVPYNVDGLRFAEEVSTEYKDIKIIIVSGSHHEWARRLRSHNFIPAFVLEKQSLEPDDLITKIHQAIAG